MVLHHMARGKLLKMVQREVGAKLLFFKRPFLQSIFIKLGVFAWVTNIFNRDATGLVPTHTNIFGMELWYYIWEY